MTLTLIRVAGAIRSEELVTSAVRFAVVLAYGTETIEMHLYIEVPVCLSKKL